MGLGEVWAERDCFLGGENGFVESAGIDEGGAEGAVGIRELGVQLGCEEKFGDGLFAFALAAVGFAEVEVEAGEFWIDGDGAANQFRALVETAGLGGQDAEEVEDVGIAGIVGKDLPVKDLGLIQTAGLMVADRQIEGLLRLHNAIIQVGNPLTT